MRIVIDIDGTISELKKPHQTYSQIKPNPEAAKKIKALKKAGHTIILHTARHMKTCGGSVKKVIAKVGKETEAWLKKHRIPYDELIFGKPYADVYIDDLSHRFHDWQSLDADHFDTDMVNIVIPMAGAGSRFQKVGFTTPKPLIPINDRTMIEWAMKSFDFLDQVPRYRLIFIILRDHEERHAISKKLRKLFKEHENVEIIVLDKLSRGQAETCLAAKHLINSHQKLFIYNCDSYSTAPEMWHCIKTEDPDGLLTCFQANEPRYSFMKTDKHGYIKETAEKKVISPYASTGMYYFRRGMDFVRTAEKMIHNNELMGNEFYVIPCYNELLKSGKKIKAVLVDRLHIFGTPEEREQFIQHLNTTRNENRSA